MEKINLSAKKRTKLGKKVKSLRESGLIPAVLYGKTNDPINLEVDVKEFIKIFDKAGTSSLVDIKIDDEKAIKTLIQDVQFDPIKSIPIHADFYRIKMDEKITTEIPIKLVGESLAVKELEGSLINNYDEIEVECLPNDLISEIEVDISTLKTFEDQIKVSDLNIPETIKVLTNPDEVVALVNPPRSEEELEAMEAESTKDAEKEGIEELEAKADAEKAEKEAEKEEATEGDTKTEDKPKEEPKK